MAIKYQQQIVISKLFYYLVTDAGGQTKKVTRTGNINSCNNNGKIYLQMEISDSFSCLLHSHCLSLICNIIQPVSFLLLLFVIFQLYLHLLHCRIYGEDNCFAQNYLELFINMEIFCCCCLPLPLLLLIQMRLSQLVFGLQAVDVRTVGGTFSREGYQNIPTIIYGDYKIYKRFKEIFGFFKNIQFRINIIYLFFFFKGPFIILDYQ